jgi:transcriptional regulator with XRE-family HTH domain
MAKSIADKQNELAARTAKMAEDDAPPFIYRNDLFRRAKSARSWLGFREIAAATNLSANTVQQAFEGNASKLETLWKLSRYFGIPWIALFDLDRKLTVKEKRNNDGPADLFHGGWFIEFVDVSIAFADGHIYMPA